MAEDKSFKRNFFINEQIRANKILLIDEEWVKLWFFSLNEALAMGQEQMKDVIQIGYNPAENIATAKLMDFGRFMYLTRKQDREKKKTQKVNLLKEVKFWYNISDHDLSLKISRAREFLEEWHTVKIAAALKWRENIYKGKMVERLEAISDQLSDVSKNQWIKEEKPWFTMILFPKWK